MSIVKAAEWSVKVPDDQELPERVQIAAVCFFTHCAQDKRKVSTIDIKPYLYRLELKPSGRLEMLLAMGGTEEQTLGGA